MVSNQYIVNCILLNGLWDFYEPQNICLMFLVSILPNMGLPFILGTFMGIGFLLVSVCYVRWSVIEKLKFLAKSLTLLLINLFESLKIILKALDVIFLYFQQHADLSAYVLEIITSWREDGQSVLLCASWLIQGGYQGEIWQIWRSAWARMPLLALVPWKSDCWPSHSTVAAIGCAMWNQDKGL